MLMKDSETVNQIERTIVRQTPLSRRMRVAARWYSQAHWSEHDIDAVLALGIAVDALIGDRNGLPTSVLAERFGLLEPNPVSRAERAKEFRELYSARSAVAHGSLSSTKIDTVFREKLVRQVCWVARRMILLDREFHPLNDTDFRSIFEDLRWGSLQWPK